MSVRTLFLYRVLRLRASGHHRIEMFLRVTKTTRNVRYIATSYVNLAENDTKSDCSTTNVQPTISRALFSRRRRSLSPLERVSSLLPQDSLTPEVEELRGHDMHHFESGTPNCAESSQQETEHLGNNRAGEMEKGGVIHCPASSEIIKDVTEHLGNQGLRHLSLQGETPLTFGEVLVAEHFKNGRVEYRKMFHLVAQTLLQSSWGVIPYGHIAGKPAGSYIKTNRGIPILIRRASLEDYVLFMKRGPAIAYPKDAAAMLMMMDVTEGDSVLEAGSGSGAMSLFLSRAVGTRGRVMSVEVREDHQKRAIKNYSRWRTSWALRRGQPWPDNVEFVQADLSTAASVLQGQDFHAVALDLLSPQMVLPIVIPHLHSGAVCTIYLANITQVIDLLEGVRCSRLPLICERIIELPSRDWIVAPALRKDGSYCTMKSPISQENLPQQDEPSENSQSEQEAAFGSIPYIAKPHPEQLSHTAFLVKLRKFVQEEF